MRRRPAGPSRPGASRCGGTVMLQLSVASNIKDVMRTMTLARETSAGRFCVYVGAHLTAAVPTRERLGYASNTQNQQARPQARC